MLLIYDYIFYIATGWLVMEFEPLKIVLAYLYSKIKPNDIIDYLLEIFNCWICCTFWSTLIITWDFRQAVVASFIVYLYDLWTSRK